MPVNSYQEVLGRIADSLATLAEGYLKCLKAHSYDFATDDGVRQAVRDIVISLGGEVKNA